MEIEIKYLSDGLPAQHIFENFEEEVLSIVPGHEAELIRDSCREKDLHAIYWDSKEGELAGEKMIFRTRKESNDYVATVKSKGRVEDAVFIRGEKNVRISEEQFKNPNIGAMRGSKIGDRAIELVGGKQLVEIMHMRVLRKSLRVKIKQTIVEICFDEGSITRNGRSEDICEIELELIDGEKRNLLFIAKFIEDLYSLKPSTKSKFERGLEIK